MVSSGTVLRDPNRAVDVEKLRGTSSAVSRLNTPFILLVVSMLPIVIVYTKTTMSIGLQPLIRVLLRFGLLIGGEFGYAYLYWLYFALLQFGKQLKKLVP